jgi:predicted Zn finger-like uncharacterized protein
MVIQCPECGKKYKIDPDKVPDKGAKISCPECGHSFVVKKKEKEAREKAPKLKTPPCAMCGNPSTRVLKGDPPLVLCEACFEREKEKRRRFEVVPGAAGEAEQPGPSAPPAPPAAEDKSGEPEYTTEPAPPGGEDYFDSFAEVPDMGDVPTDVPPAPKMARKDKTAKASEKKFEGREEAVFDEASFGESPAREAKPSEAKTSEAKPQAKSPYEEIKHPEGEQPPVEKSDSDFIFSPQEVSKIEEKQPPVEKKAEEASKLSSTYAFTPSSAKESVSSFAAAAPVAPGPDLDAEIFGEIALKTAAAAPAEPAAAKKPRRKISFKVPTKPLVAAAAAIAVLVGGYFLFTSSAARSALEKLKANASAEKQPKPLTEEEQKLLAEHINMAEALYRLDTKKNYMEALNELRAALALDPQNLQAQKLQILVSAFLAFREKNWLLDMRAKTLLKKAGPHMLAAPEVMAARILNMLTSQDFSAAKMVSEKLLADHPENALANWIAGRLCFAYTIKDLARAELLLKKAVELDPKLVAAHYDLGNLYFAKKDYALAAAAFEEALKISPDKTEAASRLAEAQAAQKQGSKPPEPKPGEQPPGLLLTQQPGTTQTGSTTKPGLIPLPGVTQAGGTASGTAAAGLDQEIQNHLLGVITETRKPMSRVRAATLPAVQPGTVPGSTASRPPEETPGTALPPAPPEEAP